MVNKILVFISLCTITILIIAAVGKISSPPIEQKFLYQGVGAMQCLYCIFLPFTAKRPAMWVFLLLLLSIFLGCSLFAFSMDQECGCFGQERSSHLFSFLALFALFTCAAIGLKCTLQKAQGQYTRLLVVLCILLTISGYLFASNLELY